MAAAFSYFSILPAGRSAAAAAPGPDALAALPLVGAALGALAGGSALLAGLVVPHPVAAAFALAVVVAGSGAIHLDGFLDGCDAFFASVTPARRFAILKDPRCGSFALAGLLIAGALWFAALSSLAISRYPLVLAFSGALARAAAVANAAVLPPARPPGEAAAALAVPPPRRPLIANWIALTIAAFWVAPYAPLLVPAALAAALGLGRWIAARLGGGLVGDAYGFIIIVLDVGILTALTALPAPG